MREWKIRLFLTSAIFTAIVTVALLPVEAAAEEEWLRTKILLGVDRIYNLDIEGGERVFIDISKKAPKNPAPWIYRAMALMSYPPRDGNKIGPKEDDILELLETGIGLSGEFIEGLEGEDIARAKLLLATAHALKAELFFREGRYLKSVESGFRSIRFLDDAYERSPDDPDLLYAVGLLKYSSDNVPKVLRPFLALADLKPDKELGFSYIKIGAERGIYSAAGAKLFLMLILVNDREDYAGAAKLGKELIGKYPNNPEVYFPYAYALSALGDYRGAFAVVDAFRAKAKAETPYFDDALTGRSHHLVGKILIDMGRLDEAKEELKRALVVIDSNYEWVRPLAFTRIGMIHDLKEERDEALKRYGDAIDSGIDGAGKILAEKYIKDPYSKEVVEGYMEPSAGDRGGGASSGPFKRGKDRPGF